VKPLVADGEVVGFANVAGELLGPRTGWMPTWLSRRVLHISIDAEMPSLTAPWTSDDAGWQ
jgi:hypothetical protein